MHIIYITYHVNNNVIYAYFLQRGLTPVRNFRSDVFFPTETKIATAITLHISYTSSAMSDF